MTDIFIDDRDEKEIREICDTLIPDSEIEKAYLDLAAYGEAMISLDPDAFKAAGIKVMAKYGKALDGLKEK